MNITIQVCIMILTAIAIAASVYFILALIYIRRAAQDVQRLAVSLRGISDFMASPWSSVLSIAGKLFSDFIEKRKNNREVDQNVGKKQR